MFKKRVLKSYKRIYKFKTGDIGFFSLKKQIFELVYLRKIKKLLRRRHIRARMKFKRKKFWFFIKPNVLFAAKSVNSRMGAGVGSYVRPAAVLKSYKSFVEFKHYSLYWVRKLHKNTRFRIPLKFSTQCKI